MTVQLPDNATATLDGYPEHEGPTNRKDEKGQWIRHIVAPSVRVMIQSERQVYIGQWAIGDVKAMITALEQAIKEAEGE